MDAAPSFRVSMISEVPSNPQLTLTNILNKVRFFKNVLGKIY